MLQPATIEQDIPAQSLPPLRVCIQGGAGAFHDIAARKIFNGQAIEIIPAMTFRELIDKVEQQEEADLGIMAIENTIAGSILFNYRLINESKLRIIGEVYLRIQQNLMALPGESIENLQEVHSHPVAIEQCREYFRKYPQIRLVETEDTALSAKNILEKDLQGVGAIASEMAAEMYDMEILAHSIETNKQNYTRFLLLQPIHRSKLPAESNKVSLCFSVDHLIGSLHKVLAVLSAYHANLTKIESAPIIGKPWEYLFFVDFVMDGDLTYQQAIEAIRPITHDLKILGIYKQGSHFN